MLSATAGGSGLLHDSSPQLPGARVAAAAGKQTPPEAPRLARTHGAGSPALRWELACLSTYWPGPQSLPS